MLGINYATITGKLRRSHVSIVEQTLFSGGFVIGKMRSLEFVTAIAAANGCIERPNNVANGIAFPIVVLDDGSDRFHRFVGVDGDGE